MKVYVVQNDPSWGFGWKVHSVHKTKKGAEKAADELQKEDQQGDENIEEFEVRE